MEIFDSIDRLSVDEINGKQAELLIETVQYVYRNSPHYKRKFDEIGLLPSHIKGVENIEKLPFTTREELQKDNWAFLTVPMKDVTEIVSTTGTTGEPAFIALTRNDLERLARNEERSFSYADVGKGDMFHIAVTCDNLFMAGIAYYSGLIRLGASVVRIGPQNIIRHLDLIKKLKPTGIVAVPSFMVHLGRRMSNNGISTEEVGIKKIVLIGDSIRDIDFKSNTLGILIESTFGNICYSTYGITELQVSFCECSEHQGPHSHSDFVIAEIVDDSGNILPDGEVGELVLTSLQLEGMPLIRYKTGDITFKISEPCQCGRKSVRIGPILGRKNHKLKVKGVTLYPKTIENAILGLTGVVNYQIEAYTGDDQTDHILLRVGSYNSNSDFISSLHEILQAKARVTPQIIIERPDEIEKRLFDGGSRKAIIFKDIREKTHV